MWVFLGYPQIWVLTSDSWSMEKSDLRLHLYPKEKLNLIIKTNGLKWVHILWLAELKNHDILNMSHMSYIWVFQNWLKGIRHVSVCMDCGCSLLITSAKKVLFSWLVVCLYICLFVCYQDYTNTNGWIFLKNKSENRSWFNLDPIKFWK